MSDCVQIGWAKLPGCHDHWWAFPNLAGNYEARCGRMELEPQGSLTPGELRGLPNYRMVCPECLEAWQAHGNAHYDSSRAAEVE